MYEQRKRMMRELSGMTAAAMAKRIAKAEGHNDWELVREYVWKHKDELGVVTRKAAKGPRVDQVRKARPLIEFHGAAVLAYMRRW